MRLSPLEGLKFPLLLFITLDLGIAMQITNESAMP